MDADRLERWLLDNGHAEEESGYGHVSGKDLAAALLARFDITPKQGCTCGRLRVGNDLTDLRNWNPDCEEHGRESDWWNSPEEVEARRVQNDRLVEIQEEARRARARARAGEWSDE
jgi:hypothetical protein